jgi:hypothetical protein
MKARIKTTTTIDASAAAVFKYLADTKLHYIWNPHLQTVSPEMKLREGAIYDTVNVLLGVRIRARNIVTIFIENRELELQNQTGMLEYRANYRLEPASTSVTKVICTTVVAAKGKTFYFAKPMMEQLAHRELKADLAALKLAVEQHLT